jgi:tetratricopeptide (TPR) repeat protein
MRDQHAAQTEEADKTPASEEADETVSRYLRSVREAGEEAGEGDRDQLLLGCLLARDAVEAVQRAIVDPQTALQVMAADLELQRLRPRLSRLGEQLVLLRRLRRPADEAWWWFPERSQSLAAERGLSVASLLLVPFSLGVALDAARRYGVEGIGVESALPIAAAALGSVSLSGVLSGGAGRGLTRWLDAAGWGRGCRLAISATTFLLLLAIFCSFLLYPRLSRHYEALAHRELEPQARDGHPQLDLGRIYLERAVRFDPTNQVAHFQLGGLYEDLLEEDKALSEYRIAVAAGLDLAYDNLGRLYLHRKEFDRAAVVLQAGLARLGRAPEPELRYAFLKNLGWARVAQKRFAEARALLLEAAALYPNRPAAHCLLAKATMGLADRAAAAEEWRRCLGTVTGGELADPDTDVWIGEAQEFLAGAAGKNRP